MKKIGLICMALVLALGLGGVAYASWNDTITIDGDVTTGTLDLSVDTFTGTWVYKVIQGYTDGEDVVHPEGEMIRSTSVMALDQDAGQTGNELLLVASAVAEQDPNGTDHDVLVTFDNLFPCVVFTADFTVHYHGTIPANLQVAALTVTGIPSAWVTITGMPTNVQVDTDTDYHVAINIHVPQPEDGKFGQGLTGTISGSIYAQQWNEPITP